MSSLPQHLKNDLRTIRDAAMTAERAVDMLEQSYRVLSLAFRTALQELSGEAGLQKRMDRYLKEAREELKAPVTLACSSSDSSKCQEDLKQAKIDYEILADHYRDASLGEEVNRIALEYACKALAQKVNYLNEDLWISLMEKAVSDAKDQLKKEGINGVQREEDEV